MTVYVLGAGASHHVGYPLSASMGSELLAWMRQKQGSPLDYRGTANLLEEIFGRIDNFEDLLTEIGSQIQRYEDGTAQQRGIRAVVAQARSTLSQGLRQWFTETRERDAAAYRGFASDILQSGDCIVDFNYDVSLDRELAIADKWRAGDGYGFVRETLRLGSVVKL